MSPPALQLKQLGLRLGQTEILRGLDLEVQRGEHLGIIGPNGAGKSSLFHLISGRLRPSAGQIWLNGERVDGRPAHAISRLGLARSFQITSLFTQLSVRDNLRCALLSPLGHRHTFWRRLQALPDVRQAVHTLLQQLELQTQAERLAGQLSYADQRVLELGLTLASGASVLLLDEPTSGLSPREAQRMTALIRQLTQGKTLLVIEHDMHVVSALAPRIAVLQAGAWLACDSAERIRAHPQVQAAYLGLPVAKGEGHAADSLA